ncbi:MAG: SMI1/KNR4 family protein [Gammaproteobacteria bacterium]|nr:SMI1/KNR4 family protein [Gammaproteobacteria bacterium]MDH5802783.1 SMI1/KNR4 family protein [Gammaproteobacteria bacterium]
MSIESLWQRLESWATGHAPELLDDLQGPASEIELQELEKRLQLALPEDLKNSLRIHNGEDDGWPARVFYEYGAYLPVPAIYSLWKRCLPLSEKRELDEEEAQNPRIQPVLFSKAWIPFMDLNGDRFWAVDLDPGKNGVRGQIIAVDWECDKFLVIADSFLDFFQTYVNTLESGTLNIELDKSKSIKSANKLQDNNMDEYFTDAAELEMQHYGRQIEYVENSTNAPDLDENDFNNGDEIVLYGTIKPNYETGQHTMKAFYIGDIVINGNLDELINVKGNRLYHVYAVKLKVNVTKRLFFKDRNYTILECKELPTH